MTTLDRGNWTSCASGLWKNVACWLTGKSVYNGGNCAERTSMTTGFRLFFRLVWLTAFRSKGTHARLTGRRLAVIALFAPAILLLQICHWFAFLLDEVFFRGYRQVEVRKPLFMIGIPRSGSTFLHRVVSKDKHNFTTLDLWEMLFAPSVIERKFWLGLGALDRLLGRPGRKLLVAFENRAFAKVRKIHRISLFEPEEDDLVLFPIFASVFLLFAFPFPEELWHLAFFDQQTAPGEKDRIMSFYMNCVKKHLYVHGAEKRFLSKNPAFSPKVDALGQWFPDANVVCTVRNPYQALPSLLSFLSFSWQRFQNDPKGDTFRDLVVEMSGHWYRHPMSRLPAWGDNRYAFVRYNELTGDPKACVEALYEQFGLEMTPEFEEHLEQEREKSRNYKSKHKYALDDYGLTSQEVLQEFNDVFDYYGFDKQYLREANTKAAEG